VIYERKGWFTIDVPDGWEGSEEEGVVVLHDPAGPGALHVSALTLDGRKPGDRIDVFIALRGYLRGTGVKMQPTKAERFSREGHEFASYEHVAQERGEGPTFWRTWFATNQDVLAMATYNCREADKDAERAAVTRAVESLRLTSVRA